MSGEVEFWYAVGGEVDVWDVARVAFPLLKVYGEVFSTVDSGH
jgi:hypothetical protein